MKRHLRLVLIIGLLAGGLVLCSPASEAGIFRRGGPFRGYGGYGRGRVFAPVGGYGVYRPYRYGWGGYGMGYRGYGIGLGRYGYGYPAYGGYGIGYPGYGSGLNYPAFGVYGMGYNPAIFGSSLSVGTGPYGGFYMNSYPY
jgi:hypothetical protein